jgi:hypothetical protein
MLFAHACKLGCEGIVLRAQQALAQDQEPGRARRETRAEEDWA